MRMRKSSVLTVLLMFWGAVALGQDRLKTMPGYEQYQRLRREIPTSVKSGALNATWTDDSKALEYSTDGKKYRFDLASRQITDAERTEQTRRPERSDSSGDETPD